MSFGSTGLGSKGYTDNDNHILASMAEPISRAIEYLRVICEPARILCSYYENPEQPLGQLMGSFSTDKLEKYSKDKSVNLFQLGYILGFYDDMDGQVRLWNAEDSPRSHSKIYKHVSELSNQDQLRFNGTSIVDLIGISIKNIKFFNDVVGYKPTVAEFQTLWIIYMKKIIPTFPYRVVGTNKIRLSNALFNFTGRQISVSKEKSGYRVAGSFFAIESVDLGGLLCRSLAGVKGQGTIFEDFNFSKDIQNTSTSISSLVEY